jgi:hypothetical protein
MLHGNAKDIVKKMGMGVGSPCQAVANIGGDLETNVEIPVVMMVPKDSSRQAILMKEAVELFMSIREIVGTSILCSSDLVEKKEIPGPLDTMALSACQLDMLAKSVSKICKSILADDSATEDQLPIVRPRSK